MINEVFQSVIALQKAGIHAEKWHTRYGPISNVTEKAPCVRIVLEGDRVAKLESVSTEKGKQIRRYGDNQGSFPAMNLAALYRITEESEKKEISKLMQSKGEGLDIERVKGWCKADNWSKKFCNKYRLHFLARPRELEDLLHGDLTFEPLSELLQAIKPFLNPEVLHRELEIAALEMLRNRETIALALQILFYLQKPEDAGKDEAGKLSVVLDTYALEDQGMTTIGAQFAKRMNAALLRAENAALSMKNQNLVDAFGSPYVPLSEPMPKVKLAAGFEVSLRTMFKGQPCQFRYGEIEDGTYPISKENRNELRAALTWLSTEGRKNKTWVSIGKNEAMFVFPSVITESQPALAQLFQISPEESSNEALFEARAKDFSDYISKTKRFDPEHAPEWIQFFVLKKVDKACSKVMYSYNAAPMEIVQRSEEWQSAARNLPKFRFGSTQIPFPLSIAETINDVWRRDGSLAGEKSEIVSSFYGMQLFFGQTESVLQRDLRNLIQNSSPLAVCAGNYLNRSQSQSLSVLPKLKGILSLMGMLLYWIGYREEDYVKEFPYLLGQLLKAADCLHELYCYEVRNKQIPSQLVGGSMYTAATEFPLQTLAQLGQRMNPYLNWANAHKDARITEKGENGAESVSPSAGYYLFIFRQIADQLSEALREQTRFSDAEKAQLFIGYLASFPKKSPIGVNEEENSTENKERRRTKE